MALQDAFGGFKLPQFSEFFEPSVVVNFTLGTARGLTGLFIAPSVLRVGLLDSHTDSLRMEWDITLSRTSNADEGRVIIYNLNAAHRLLLMEQWKLASSDSENPLTLNLVLGWGGSRITGGSGAALPVFQGQVWHILPDERTGTDVLTIVDAGDGSNNLRDSVPPQATGFSDLSAEVILKYLVEQVIKVPISAEALTLFTEKIQGFPIKLFNNYVPSFDSADALDEYIDMLGLEWKIFQGEFILMDKGVRATTVQQIPLLSPGTGMLSWTQEDDDNVRVTSLAYPGVEPGLQVAVQDENGLSVGAPRHRVSQVRFFGSNHNDSLMEITARKAILVPA